VAFLRHRRQNKSKSKVNPLPLSPKALNLDQPGVGIDHGHPENPQCYSRVVDPDIELPPMPRMETYTVTPTLMQREGKARAGNLETNRWQSSVETDVSTIQDARSVQPQFSLASTVGMEEDEIRIKLTESKSSDPSTARI